MYVCVYVCMHVNLKLQVFVFTRRSNKHISRCVGKRRPATLSAAGGPSPAAAYKVFMDLAIAL